MNYYKKRLLILLGVSLLTLGLGACQPIEGLDADMNETTEEVITPVETVEEVTLEETEPVVEQETEPEALEEVIIANYIRVDTLALNVRSEASVDVDILTKIYENQIYPVEGSLVDTEGMTWYQVTAADGVNGWVSGDYCVIGETYQELIVEEIVEEN